MGVVSFCTLSAQKSDCENLAKENKFLKEKLTQFGVSIAPTETSVVSFNPNLVVNFIKAEGNIKQQTVTVYFNVVNPNLPIQKFIISTGGTLLSGNLGYTTSYDEIGNGFKSLSATIGAVKNEKFNNDGFGSRIFGKLNTGNQPLMCSITFGGIIAEKTKKFSHIDVFMDTNDVTASEWQDSKKQGITVIKDVNINWK